jgi:hypothetical protein
MIDSPFEDRPTRSALKGGCLLLLAVGVVALGVFVMMGRRVERQVKRQALDPAVQLARAQELFGVDRLPAGFQVRLVAKVPLLGRVGALELPAVGDEFLVERAREMLLALRSDESLEVGAEDQALVRLLAVRGLSLEHERVVDAHGWSLGASRIEQRALRATLRWKPDGGRAVLASIAEFTCRPADERRRVMLWIVTDPAPGRELEPLDGQGTPADRTAVEQMFSRFDPCRE